MPMERVDGAQPMYFSLGWIFAKFQPMNLTFNGFWDYS